ncbi:Hypothetical protein PFR_JS23-PH_46 [Propionibacterium freudenreichii]|uniref:Uncharacterized protein n=1 Tax=Propionibacterium freudenreichii TaxID=1744 RepID=A0A509MHC3_9ACTN|nr:Hypothetical protein PFR_JS23-PH_46 [Propionibacterium freudenreichii]SUY93604.1 Hypothetical protein PFR_JS23-PH_46 [Propionibacterium freudenreichii]
MMAHEGCSSTVSVTLDTSLSLPGEIVMPSSSMGHSKRTPSISSCLSEVSSTRLGRRRGRAM